MRKEVRNILNILLNLLLPHQCLGCNSFCTANLCNSCRDAISLNSASILLNRKSIECFAFLPFEGLQKQLLCRLKYDHWTQLESLFFDYLKTVTKIPMLKEADFFIPVPLHKSRLRKRGFNQVEIIFKRWVEEYLGKKYLSAFIERSISTPALFELTPKEREQILASVFVLKDAASIIENQKIIILDDIFTTGQTMSEIASLLKNAGAAQVKGLSFCYAKD